MHSVPGARSARPTCCCRTGVAFRYQSSSRRAVLRIARIAARRTNMNTILRRAHTQQLTRDATSIGTAQERLGAGGHRVGCVGLVRGHRQDGVRDRGSAARSTGYRTVAISSTPLERMRIHYYRCRLVGEVRPSSRQIRSFERPQAAGQLTGGPRHRRRETGMRPAGHPTSRPLRQPPSTVRSAR
jgi:hypothetical protein